MTPILARCVHGTKLKELAAIPGVQDLHLRIASEPSEASALQEQMAVLVRNDLSVAEDIRNLDPHHIALLVDLYETKTGEDLFPNGFGPAWENIDTPFDELHSRARRLAEYREEERREWRKVDGPEGTKWFRTPNYIFGFRCLHVPSKVWVDVIVDRTAELAEYAQAETPKHSWDHYAKYLGRLIDHVHAGLSLYNLKPNASASPVRLDVQEKQIAKLHDISAAPPAALVMLGPPGTSKSAFASVLIKDWLTWHVSKDVGERGLVQPNVYRIKVPAWCDQYLRYRTRNWSEKWIKPPKVTSRRVEVRTAKTKRPPILWIDEIDKIAGSKAQMDLLESLVDLVYANEGTLIVTSNHTRESFAKALSPSLLRRFLGTHEPEYRKDQFVLWDFHKAPRSR